MELPKLTREDGCPGWKGSTKLPSEVERFHETTHLEHDPCEQVIYFQKSCFLTDAFELSAWKREALSVVC